MDEADSKNLLIKKLNFFLHTDYHSVTDLSMRDVMGDKGSLCGLSALYQAGVNTLLTVSHLKQLSYDDIRKILTEEMDSPTAAAMTDSDFLKEFNKCQYSIAASNILNFFIRDVQRLCGSKEKRGQCRGQ